MNQSVYDENYIDFLKEPLFFGKGRNSQRFDVLKYPFYDNTNDKMLGCYWRPDEIDVSRDKRDFHQMPQNMKDTYTRVLQKLIFLDSVQGRGMLQTFGNLITNPEFENCVTTWQFFEGSIHSRSYTHILRSVYDNPTEIFDASFDIKQLTSLAKETSKSYDNCWNQALAYLYETNTNFGNKRIEASEDFKKALLYLLLEINILEGIRFYSGFATIWSMHYAQGFMERTTKILQLICRDENLHLQLTQYTLRLLRDSKEEGFQKLYADLEQWLPSIYEAACEQEFEWIDFLFEGGAFLGMSPDLAKAYIKYICNRRLKTLGAEILYPDFIKNPIPWVDSYINSDANEVLPQEVEITNYKFDILNKQIKDSEIEALKKEL